MQADYAPIPENEPWTIFPGSSVYPFRTPAGVPQGLLGGEDDGQMTWRCGVRLCRQTFSSPHLTCVHSVEDHGEFYCGGVEVPKCRVPLYDGQMQKVEETIFGQFAHPSKEQLVRLTEDSSGQFLCRICRQQSVTEEAVLRHAFDYHFKITCPDCGNHVLPALFVMHMAVDGCNVSFNFRIFNGRFRGILCYEHEGKTPTCPLVVHSRHENPNAIDCDDIGTSQSICAGVQPLPEVLESWFLNILPSTDNKLLKFSFGTFVDGSVKQAVLQQTPLALNVGYTSVGTYEAYEKRVKDENLHLATSSMDAEGKSKYPPLPIVNLLANQDGNPDFGFSYSSKSRPRLLHEYPNETGVLPEEYYKPTKEIDLNAALEKNQEPSYSTTNSGAILRETSLPCPSFNSCRLERPMGTNNNDDSPLPSTEPAIHEQMEELEGGSPASQVPNFVPSRDEAGTKLFPSRGSTEDDEEDQDASSMIIDGQNWSIHTMGSSSSFDSVDYSSGFGSREVCGESMADLHDAVEQTVEANKQTKEATITDTPTSPRIPSTNKPEDLSVRTDLQETKDETPASYQVSLMHLSNLGLRNDAPSLTATATEGVVTTQLSPDVLGNFSKLLQGVISWLELLSVDVLTARELVPSENWDTWASYYTASLELAKDELERELSDVEQNLGVYREKERDIVVAMEQLNSFENIGLDALGPLNGELKVCSKTLYYSLSVLEQKKTDIECVFKKIVQMSEAGFAAC